MRYSNPQSQQAKGPQTHVLELAATRIEMHHMKSYLQNSMVNN